MRQIVLDTETTGLEWKNGDRIIEIGCVELINRALSGNDYHVYLNPEREISAEASGVHGLTNAFLADKPLFAQVADEFADYLRDAELIIHNASFDVGFIDSEFARLGREPVSALCAGVVDTLKMAKTLNPGKKASLNALCERYEIDYAHRTLHGALLDAQILASVYLAMTRGQESLLMSFDMPDAATNAALAGAASRGPLPVIRPSAEELAAHERYLDAIDKACGDGALWRRLAAEGRETPQ